VADNAPGVVTRLPIADDYSPLLQSLAPIQGKLSTGPTNSCEPACDMLCDSFHVTSDLLRVASV
jgi:hypothetical protein